VSAGVALAAYVVAATVEAIAIGVIRPTEWELAWISDVVLAAAFGGVVYLWQHLRLTRQALATRERADLVLQTQLAIAADIQQRLLPQLPARTNGVEWAAALRSAGRIGGDFYDVAQVALGRWILLVADVSGKGIPAAMALGSLRTAFRSLVHQHGGPAAVLTHLSSTLFEAWQGSPYATAIIAQLEASGCTLTYANAGHPAAIVSGRAGVRRLEADGPPIGLFPSATYAEQTLILQHGDTCVIVSDGVTEALESADVAPLDQVIEAADGAKSAQEVCDAVMGLALRGTGPRGVADWQDDRTVVVVAVRALQAP
jgi:sigma-B regulation protein RsbU (phosphoserine phosphatase)